MTIEIARPEIEAFIQQRLHSGAIHVTMERGLAQLAGGEIPGDERRASRQSIERDGLRSTSFMKFDPSEALSIE